MRSVRRFVRGNLAELIAPRPGRGLLLLLALLLLFPVAARAVTPTPHPVMTTFKIRITPPPYPKIAMHADYTVEVNRKGQVTRVRSVRPSKIPGFDALTYGNTLQAFIRTPDGRAIAGVYRLSYDYSPKTKKVHRGVELLQAGGVNPDAPGAVDVELAKDAKRRAADAAKEPPKPMPSMNFKLPGFDTIVTPKPSGAP